MEFNRKNLIEAINKIDKNASLRNNKSSSTYDLIFENKKYKIVQEKAMFSIS